MIDSSSPTDANEIRIPISFVDLRAALRHDARIAHAEGFPMVEARALAILEELDIADQTTRHWANGYTVAITITRT